MLNWVKVNRLKLIIVTIVILFILVIYSMLILQFPKNQLLSYDELKTLITEKGIEPNLINHIGDSYTVILYDDVDNKGNAGLMAYKNRWNNIKTKPFGFDNSEMAGKMNVVFWSTNPKSYNLIGYIGMEIIE